MQLLVGANVLGHNRELLLFSYFIETFEISVMSVLKITYKSFLL